MQTGSGEFQIQFHATKNIFKNNILNANAQDLFINNFTSAATPVADVNYNLYFSSAGAANSTWLWNNVTYTGYSAYLAGTKNDGNSKFADPLFVSLTAPDLHVKAASPANDAGINLGASVVGTQDLDGHPRVQGANIDIGAYEQ